MLYFVRSSVRVAKYALLLVDAGRIGPHASDVIFSPGCAVVGLLRLCVARFCFPCAHAEQVISGGVLMRSLGMSCGVFIFAMVWAVCG